MVRISVLIIGAAIICALLVPLAAHADTANISILYTADTHGHLHPFFYESRKPVGGIAKRAIFFQEKRRHKSMIWLTVDTGDALSGTPIADVFDGYVVVQAMNKLKYDAMCPGVHDFDFGADVLKQRIAEAEFPVVCANIRSLETGEPFTAPYIILEREGVRIAIFGLITGDLSERAAPENIPNLQVLDPVQTAKQLIPQLSPQADVIIALTHLGINEDIRLASEVRGIDVIIGGMSHSELQVPMKFEETLIVHNPEYARSVGMLKLSYDPVQNYKRVYFYNEIVPMAGDWVENSNYVEWLDSYNAELSQRMETIIGSAGIELTTQKIRSAETLFGNYVTDVLRTKTNADVALLPAAFFAGTIPSGPVTLGDLYTALPYDHYAEVVEVTGGELKEIFDEAASQIGKSGFPQISGASFGILGGRAYQILVGNQQLDPFATYRVVTSDAMADGKYGYSRLGTISQRSSSGYLIRDLVRSQLATGQAAQASLGSRITFHAYDPSIDQAGGSSAGNLPAASTTQQPVENVPATTTPASSTPSGDSSELQPADANPAGSSYSSATGDSTTPPADDTPSDGGLDDLRYDRNGQPLGSPVVVEDEVITDTNSEMDGTSAPSSDEGYPATTPPEATGQQIPPVSSIPEQVQEQVPVLGSTRTSQGGLDYLFTLSPGGDGLELRLQITNVTSMPIELTYDTNEKFDFLAKYTNDLVWNYHYNWFFMQSQQTVTISPGDTLDFNAEWDGLSNDGMASPSRALRFEAVHHLRDNPVRLELEAVMP